jgi:hypothetical protein
MRVIYLKYMFQLLLLSEINTERVNASCDTKQPQKYILLHIYICIQTYPIKRVL